MHPIYVCMYLCMHTCMMIIFLYNYTVCIITYVFYCNTYSTIKQDNLHTFSACLSLALSCWARSLAISFSFSTRCLSISCWNSSSRLYIITYVYNNYCNIVIIAFKWIITKYINMFIIDKSLICQGMKQQSDTGVDLCKFQFDMTNVQANM